MGTSAQLADGSVQSVAEELRHRATFRAMCTRNRLQVLAQDDSAP